MVELVVIIVGSGRLTLEYYRVIEAFHMSNSILYYILSTLAHTMPGIRPHSGSTPLSFFCDMYSTILIFL